MKSGARYTAGFTLRALLASLFGIVVVTVVVQFFEVIESSDSLLGTYALPLPAMFVVIPLMLVSGVIFAATRFRLLNRAEMLVVMSALFLATPLVSTGFWTMMIGAIGTIPKTADFETYDAWPKRLWPHGENVIGGVLNPADRGELRTSGTVSWEDAEYERGRRGTLPVLANTDEGAVSWLRVGVPVAEGAPAGVVAGDPHILSVLLRPEELAPGAYYYCRIYYDDDSHFETEAFSSRSPGERNYLHQCGFVRKGMYGLTFSDAAEERVWLEFGLVGAGRLAVADVELMNVGTLDSIYRGRTVVAQSEAERSGEVLPSDVVVRPDNLWSIEGICFVARGYVPWKDWFAPLTAWAGFVFLCLVGLFCLAVLMRRQWIENERYALPLTRIPSALLGDGSDDARPLSAIWRNKTMWMGFAATLFWCFLKGWHAFNTNVPDTSIEVQLTPYFTDTMWGKMWYGEAVRNVTFSVTALFLSLAIFMELNVLMSLVLGFFLFRCQHWFGEATGLALNPDYPYFRTAAGRGLSWVRRAHRLPRAETPLGHGARGRGGVFSAGSAGAGGPFVPHGVACFRSQFRGGGVCGRVGPAFPPGACSCSTASSCWWGWWP